MLTVSHIELKDANAYVTAHHRHHKAVRGHRFSLACSKLYGACRRAAKVLGYERLITYTLAHENGKSLLASGFSYCYTSKGGSWNQPGRPRTDQAPVCPKYLYEIILVRKEDESCRTS